MVSRRNALIGAAAAVVTALSRRTPVVLAIASQPSTAVNFDVPAGACDCHTHIFGDPRRFPFWPERTYTPEPASVAELRTLHRALHIDRVVIVNPTVYGADNACTLDAIKQLGPRARGIALIDDKTTDSQLDAMDRAGMRGIRLNFETFGVTDASAARQRFQAAVQRLAGRQWHIQINTRLSVIEALQDQVMAAPMPVVFDHFGNAQASRGFEQSGFGALLNLVQSGKAYVKISTTNRVAPETRDYADVALLAKALITAHSQRILWGTNWPHPNSTPLPGKTAADINPLFQIDEGRVLNLLPLWAPDAALRKTILVDNPARLYGF